jgi:hypothetical protein
VSVGSSDSGSEFPTPVGGWLIVPKGGPQPAVFNRVGSFDLGSEVPAIT